MGIKKVSVNNVIKTPKQHIEVNSIPDINVSINNLKNKGITIKDSVLDFDNKTMSKTFNKVNEIFDKYPKLVKDIKMTGYTIDKYAGKGRSYAKANNKMLLLSFYYYKNSKYDEYLKTIMRDGESGFHYKFGEDNSIESIVSHELGHTLELNYVKVRVRKTNKPFSKTLLYDYDDTIMSYIYRRASDMSGMSISEVEKTYLTGYGKSTKRLEPFAETFGGLQCGIDNPLTKAMEEWLEEQYK